MVRVFHPPSHVTHWSPGQVMFQKGFIFTFARTMATNFSKVWLKLSWSQALSHMTHLSRDHVIFAKRCISSFTAQGRVNEPHLLFQVNCRSHAFWETSCIYWRKATELSWKYAQQINWLVSTWWQLWRLMSQGVIQQPLVFLSGINWQNSMWLADTFWSQNMSQK